MAHLKDLIVSGVSRFLGTIYGNLVGLASNAKKDDKDQDIASTYVKDVEGGVNSITITKGDGSSSEVTMCQLVPFNMAYFINNDRIKLWTMDDNITRGISFKNNTNSTVTVVALISASGSGPICQYGYGTNTYPEIQDTGNGRDWYAIASVPTDPTPYAMDVPAGKVGYYGFYKTTESSEYIMIHDIKFPYEKFFG